MEHETVRFRCDGETAKRWNLAVSIPLPQPVEGIEPSQGPGDNEARTVDRYRGLGPAEVGAFPLIRHF